jgi:prepilin-type N-terminal cleavage/methylation domain-containing protein
VIQAKKAGLIKDNTEGFSLVELVIVIAILAILVALLVPRIVTHTYRAERTREIANARMLAGEVATYNATAKLNGTNTIPSTLSGIQELTKSMLDSTSLALPDDDGFPDISIVKIYVDSDGNTLIEIFD